MIKSVDFQQFSSIEEAFSVQPRKSVAKIFDSFQEEPTVFFLMKGGDDGPTVWIQAALHGDEYDGVVVCIHLLESIDVDFLKGNILICPVANPNAFLTGTNSSSIDHVNINRIFNGDERGTYSYLYGDWLFRKIAAYADFFIDLHGGGQYLDVCPFVMVASNDSAAYEKALAVLNNVNLTAVYECNSSTKGMFINEVCKHGIPAVLLESGGGSFWTEKGVAQHEQSLQSILAQLGMLTDSQEPVTSKSKPEHIREIKELRFEVSGMQTYRAEAGDRVERGDLLLEVLAYPEFERKKITCPIKKGIILSIHTASVVKPNDYAVMLGIIQTS